jgi:class 3 adenylate cyclase
MATPIRFEERAVFKLTPTQLWSFVADTNRLNKLVGLPDMHFSTRPLASGGAEISAEYRLGPFLLARWTELPMEWSIPHRYAVERLYRWGPLARFWGGVELRPIEPVDGTPATELRIFADVTPAWGPIGWLAVRIAIGPTGVARAMAQCRDYERKALVESIPSGHASQEAPPRVQTLCRRLGDHGVSDTLIARLQQHVTEAEPEALVHMRPFELADRWGLDRRAVLIALLHASRVGLVTMSWDVLCPNCRIAKASSASLRDVASEAHCDACNVTFSTGFDRLVEVRFTVARGIRDVTSQLFCVGGPMNTPHVVSQMRLGSGREAALTIGESGRFRLRTNLGGTPAVIDVAAGSHPEVTVAVSSAGIDPVAADLAPGGALVVRNRADGEAKVVLESDVWPDTAATAAYVSTIGEFRDLFGSEVLAAGLNLAVESLTFLFTDLTGSTAMYQRIGQARAFSLVQEHFRILGEAIDEHRGTIVKTIGDAVMAVFPTPTDGLDAALTMQERIRALDSGGSIDAARFLKIGLHAGPALVVTQNERLDYFGTTVNVASRIEHSASGGQIALSEAIWGDPEVERRLSALNLPTQRSSTQLRGVAEPVQLIVLGPAPTSG